MFKIALSGQMFDDFPCQTHLDAAVKYGYEAVQLRSTHVKPGISDSKLGEIISFLSENEMPVNGLSCFIGNYGMLGDSECEDAFEVFKSYVLLALEVNAPMVRAWPAWQESKQASPELWKRAATWMARSGDFAAEHGIKVAMEMHHGTLLDTAESSVKLLDMINRDNVGVIFDAVNLYQVPTDYGRDAIKRLGGKIFDVHIKDIVRLVDGCYPYSFEYSYYAKHIGRFTKVADPSDQEERWYCHRRINHGGVDWSAIISSLKEIGYEGYLTVESVSETNRLMPSDDELAKVCAEDILALQKALQ